jgi:hypothetical protein
MGGSYQGDPGELLVREGVDAMTETETEGVTIPTALARPFDGPGEVAEVVAEAESPRGEQQVLCPAAYDEPRRPAERGGDGGGGVESHNCSLDTGHEGLHHCDGCGRSWLARVGVADVAVSAREQVDAARQDARAGGNGFVGIVRGRGGRLEYERIAPERVMVKAENNDRKDAVT